MHTSSEKAIPRPYLISSALKKATWAHPAHIPFGLHLSVEHDARLLGVAAANAFRKQEEGADASADRHWMASAERKLEFTIAHASLQFGLSTETARAYYREIAQESGYEEYQSLIEADADKVVQVCGGEESDEAASHDPQFDTVGEGQHEGTQTADEAQAAEENAEATVADDQAQAGDRPSAASSNYGNTPQEEGQGEEGPRGEGIGLQDTQVLHTPIRPARCREGRNQVPNRHAKKSANGFRQGYIIDRQKDLEPRVQYVDRHLEGFGDDDRHFYKHVLVSGLTNENVWNGGWVPVSSELRHAKLRDANPRALRDKGLLRMKPYSQAEGRCYEFRVSPAIVEHYVEMAPCTVEEYKRWRKVDLFTGKKTTFKQKSQTRDNNRHSYPEIIRTAMNTIEWSYFDAPAVEKHLAGLKARWESVKSTHSPESRRYQEVRGQYLNDRTCFVSVMHQDPEHVGGGIYRYRPAYRVQKSGRFSEVGGGLQSCSREMKQAARGQVKNMRNYDLKSSQPYGLIQLLEVAAIDASWLRNYVADGNAKHHYAAAAGIPVDDWKSVLCAVFMGALLPSDIRFSKGAIQKVVKDNAGWKWADQEATYERIVVLLAPLKERLDEWHLYLRTAYLKENVKVCRGGRYLENAAGMKLYVDEIQEEWALGAQIAAFLLQGQEAAFIHHLTALAPEYNFEVMANEHDGLVTIGEIPHEAVEEAARCSGLKYAMLEVKGIV